MNFLDTWQQLDEIYSKIDFESGSENQYYHFYADLADLVNSLDTCRIYSNKNVHASQLDIFAPDDAAYVCMTVGKEGKHRTVHNFGNRLFGISFKNLPELCRDRNYTFATDKAYSQFAAKTQYSLGTIGKEKGQPTRSSGNKTVNAFRDFELLAIGALGGEYEGQYFISGGQGRI